MIRTLVAATLGGVAATAAGLLWSAILAGAIVGATLPTHGVEPMVPPAPVTWPACPQEDSPGPCRWDAQAQGNGEGTSFYVIMPKVRETR